MTLGGFAIAIGELVDDAIIDVENVYRRLRENARALPERAAPTARRRLRRLAGDPELGGVRHADHPAGLRPAVLPERDRGPPAPAAGRRLRDQHRRLAVVALTITPVLCLLLLGRHSRSPRATRESPLAAAPEGLYRPDRVGLAAVADADRLVSSFGAVAAVAALFVRAFVLAGVQRGLLNIAAATAPGTSLETSDRSWPGSSGICSQHPAVTSVIRSTGRAERDEHALDVNFSELEVGLDLSQGRSGGDPRRDPGPSRVDPRPAVTVGQPISHRIEHLVSGVRANLAVKIYGPTSTSSGPWRKVRPRRP
jgi:Cu/Ag efflux pump CusA